MNLQLTDITFLLDRSGSMKSLHRSAIKGFNQFLCDQQKVPGQARFSLIQFDDRYEVWAHALPIAEVLPLTLESYQPRGSTALLDAIGRTIDETGRRLAAMPEPGRPGKVIIVIMTDGLENSSTQYSRHDIATRIAHQRDAYAWEFLFLGANQDAIATAAAMNINAQNAATFQASQGGTLSSYRSISRKSSSIRSSQLSPSAPPPEDLHKPLQDIVKEEEEGQTGT